MGQSDEHRPEPTPHEALQAENVRRDDQKAEVEHPSIKFEQRDISFRWVLIVAIAFFGVGAAMFILVFEFYRADTKRLASRRESEFPLAEHPSTALPASPRLEQIDRLAGIPAENVYLRLSAKEDQLELYGETGEKGFVHIPIRRAMESLAGRLPVRKHSPTGGKDYGLVDFGASNSGRMFRGSPP